MQVLLAGATGAIGRPLIRTLTANGHTVSALVRNPNANPLVRELGATPVTADVLDREALLRAVDGSAEVQRRIPAGGVNTWVHVDDAAVATVAALERGAPGRAYNIADDNPITWQEFFAEVAGRHRTPRPIRLPA